MFHKLLSISTRAWMLLALVVTLAIASAVLRSTGIVPASVFLYGIQPLMASSVALVVYLSSHGRQDHVRHKSEKAMIVGSIVAIWFVLYFLSGLIVTYTHNALVADIKGVLFNVFSYGIVAASMEYARYHIMLLVGRRNIIWFGSIVAIVFALQQMNLYQLSDARSVESLVKLIVADFIPVTIGSLLLSYLAISSGLPAMLTYRLGTVAVLVLPPIIPRYDWYLIGVSSILLAVAVYVAVDRSQQARNATRANHHKHHVSRAYDIMLIAVLIGLISFMSGFFAYKPLVIMSNSMHPVFSKGSVVIVQKGIGPMDITVGDIIQYESAGKMITHRVVATDAAKDGSGTRVFTTKGDNNPSEDPLVAEKQLVGVVRSQVPYIGYPTVWLRELAP